MLLLYLLAILTSSVVSSTPRPIACVTGGSGFLGLEVVSQLLERGFLVRATVRDPMSRRKVKPLRELGHQSQLTIVQADLLQGVESFKECVAGAKFLFHTASPFQTKNITNPDEQLVQPALRGTEAAVGAALLSPTIKYIIITSSIAATMSSSQDKNGDCFTEMDWNIKSTAEAGGLDAYRYSKTVAEKRFWEMLDQVERKIEGAAILPSFIIGPQRTTRIDGESATFIKMALEGVVPYRGDTAMCDVRDVALAHIHVAEMMMSNSNHDNNARRSQEKRRYIISSETAVRRSSVLTWLRNEYPQYSIAGGDETSIRAAAAAATIPKQRLFCPTNLKDIQMHDGLNMHEPKDSILAMATAMLNRLADMGLVNPIPTGSGEVHDLRSNDADL